MNKTKTPQDLRYGSTTLVVDDMPGRNNIVASLIQLQRTKRDVIHITPDMSPDQFFISLEKRRVLRAPETVVCVNAVDVAAKWHRLMTEGTANGLMVLISTPSYMFTECTIRKNVNYILRLSKWTDEELRILWYDRLFHSFPSVEHVSAIYSSRYRPLSRVVLYNDKFYRFVLDFVPNKINLATMANLKPNTTTQRVLLVGGSVSQHRDFINEFRRVAYPPVLLSTPLSSSSTPTIHEIGEFDIDLFVSGTATTHSDIVHVTFIVFFVQFTVIVDAIFHYPAKILFWSASGYGEILSCVRDRIRYHVIWPSWEGSQVVWESLLSKYITWEDFTKWITVARPQCFIVDTDGTSLVDRVFVQ